MEEQRKETVTVQELIDFVNGMDREFILHVSIEEVDRDEGACVPGHRTE